MNKEWKITSKKKTLKNKEALKDIVIAKDGEFYFYLPEHVETLRQEILSLFCSDCDINHDAAINRLFGVEDE